MSLFRELKRRNVFRVAAAYTVAAWLAVQVAETIFPLFGYGDTPARIVVVVLAIGFVPAIVISWVFELTPEGLKRETDVDREQSVTPHTGKKLDRITIAVLAIAVAFFAFDRFVLDPQRDIELAESATRAGAEQAREEARLDMFSDKSIAVLPFANRSAQQEDEYFTDGMHDELLTRLARIAALKVISRTSVMKYRGTEQSIPEIGKELSVATVLEGGVQRSGNHVRINVQLIDARTDEHLWAEIYDRELTAENLFAIQSEISTAIAEALEATLSPEERTRVYDLPTSSLEAYNHYLRGRQSMATREREDLELALAEFEQAVEIDPEFALAWVGVGDSVHLLAEIGSYDWVEHLERHGMAAEKALALNDQLGEAYTSMAFVYGERREHEKEIAAFEKAIELNPSYAQAYHWYANSLGAKDQEEKRLPLLYKAAQLDPRSLIIQLNIAGQLMDLGREGEAREVIDRMLEMDPGFSLAYRFLGTIELSHGRLAGAVEYFRKGIKLDPGNATAMEQLAFVYVALEDWESVDGMLTDLEEIASESGLSYIRLNFFKEVGQENYQAAIELVEDWPEQLQETGLGTFAYAATYLLARDYESSRDYVYKWWPYLADRERWSQEFTDIEDDACEFAGVLIEAGDPAGEDLRQLFVQIYEEMSANNQPVGTTRPTMMQCYLLEGSHEKALDILDLISPNGSLLEWWWYYRLMPWWEPVKDDPRYLELVERIDGLLDEQRALLN